MKATPLLILFLLACANNIICIDAWPGARPSSINNYSYYVVNLLFFRTSLL